jgi:hypothetical protein
MILTTQILIFHSIFHKNGKVTKNCIGIYRKLEKSRVLNIIHVVEGLQIHNILEICYSYN